MRHVDRHPISHIDVEAKNGFQQWLCSVKKLDGMKKSHRRHLKSLCDRCGFVPISMIQMDGHHRDHNHTNNSPENIETLCANCHRLCHPSANREYSSKPLATTLPGRRDMKGAP